MNGEQIAGAIIMALCNFLCAAIFYGIGVHASCTDKPVNFWSGIKVDTKKVSDVYAYNAECSVMWKVYSVPFWIAGVSGALSGRWEYFNYISLAIEILSFFPGLIMLIKHYKGIEKRYIFR